MDLVLKDLWEREYRTKGVPTSFKEEPSQCLGYFLDYLRGHEIPLRGRLLDLGCGNGRNGLHFARAGLEVHAVDIAENALSDFKAKADRERAADRVHFHCRSIDEPLPLGPEYFDFAICLTVMENLLTDWQVNSFKAEVFRLLKTGGYFLLYFLTEQDGFYRPVLDAADKGTIFIPDTGMTQRIFSKAEARELFQDVFRACDSHTFEFEDERFGRRYMRELVAFIFQKRAPAAP
jgi:SAM-dependent methyltransferase